MVGVRDRNRQRIGGIGARDLRARQQTGNHGMDLRFFCTARADYRLLDQPRRILADLEPMARSSKQNDAAGLAQLERGLRVHIDEYLLHSRRFRMMRRKQRIKRVVQGSEASWQGYRAVGPHLPISNVREPVTLGRDDAPTGRSQARVEANQDQATLPLAGRIIKRASP